MDDLMSFDASPVHETVTPGRRDAEPATSVFDCAPLDSSQVNLRESPNVTSSTSGALDPKDELAVANDAAFEAVLHRPRQPVYLDAPPLLEQWAKGPKGKERLRQQGIPTQRGRACLVLSHNGQVLDGVLLATYEELAEVAKDQEGYLFEIQEPLSGRPFLYIEAPSQSLAASCLDEARTIAQNIIDDKATKLDLVLIEPPSAPLQSLVVQLQLGRPQLVANQTSPLDPDNDGLRKTWFESKLRQELSWALKKAGRIKNRVTLRVHLGHFLLRSFPPQQSRIPGTETGLDFEAFHRAVRHPRTRHDFATKIGSLEQALRVLQAIKSQNELFCSEDMAITLADVQPEYYFGGEVEEWQFSARLRPWSATATEMKRGKKPPKPFQVAAVEAVKIARSNAGSQLDFKCLNLEQFFDWKIDTVPEAPIRTKGFDILNSELRAADIQVPESTGVRDGAFPRIHFRGKYEKAKALNKVAIKSVFRFRYRPAPYQVEVTITREWEKVVAMGDQPLNSFGVVIYGERWGESRALELTKTGQGWGPELEHLFVDRQNDIHAGLDRLSSGDERAQCLIDAIHNIRSALSV
ncbi:hypothetical protein PFICI_00636 [Pestalotiopsis fici W106-1]|uniref:DUF7905 domain-containing protein n=1 Tax=Pestalotiopsis fici (strain W106-1 / CGMCC3.15140) TaxID=1229662 RepID=W3XL70_PESFW|nr:uncharacterized protein PFICI_00636 [Pestalotiopsis fici W106-1]ETS86808.1 hypothetical protein PFICI_00636 [Pestalotiopsis fici W106-1]